MQLPIQAPVTAATHSCLRAAGFDWTVYQKGMADKELAGLYNQLGRVKRAIWAATAKL